MRTLSALVALATLVFHLPAQAQDPGETQAARADLQAERTKTVANNLQLTEAEAAKFWPLYNEYRGETSKLDDRALALLNDFAANYDALSDEKAKDLLKRQLALEDDRLKLRRGYVGKFEKVVPPKKVARYYQIERKLDAMVAFEAARSVPLAQ
jgi:Spy/CpxP family protein refolding chaperone